jgi:heat shock protein HslJ
MLRLKNLFVPLVGMAVLLAVSGCSQGGDQSPSLSGTGWKLVALNGREPLEGTEITLVFEEENAGGNAGCNSYGGKYQSEPDGKLQFMDIAQTLMFCMEPEGVMDQETEYSNLLLQAASYQIANDRLEIQDEGGDTILKYEQQ